MHKKEVTDVVDYEPMNAEVIFEETVERMKSLGTYKPEFDLEIMIYAEIVEQYRWAVEDWKNYGDSEYEVTGGGGRKTKSPYIRSMEQLRRDILTYSDRLGLNPKAHEAMDIKHERTSRLAEALAELK